MSQGTCKRSTRNIMSGTGQIITDDLGTDHDRDSSTA
jgi:hypothetical protein